MLSQSKVEVRGQIYHTGGTTKFDLPDFENLAGPSANSVVQQVVLSNGANTITVPSGCRGAAIKFADGSTVTKTLKGVSGDTGIAIDTTGWTILRFTSSPPASFVITTSGADTGYTTYIYFF